MMYLATLLKDVPASSLPAGTVLPIRWLSAMPGGGLVLKRDDTGFEVCCDVDGVELRRPPKPKQQPPQKRRPMPVMPREVRPVPSPASQTTIAYKPKEARQTAPSEQGPFRVFVYGTLMRGQSNHRLLKHARYLGPARTSLGWAMVDKGYFPAAVLALSPTRIKGEVYEVTAEELAALDRLEGVPHHYRRVRVQLDGWVHQNKVTMMYMQPHADGSPEVVGGDWRKRKTSNRRDEW